MPIESAPKDGTRVLIAGGTFAVYDHMDLDASNFVTMAYWDKVRMHWHGEEANAHDEFNCHLPTHWMPIPEPPK